jgi:hypothetical protein
MNRLAPHLVVLAAALLLVPPVANAQLFRAYLASYGSDANPCSVSQPCRLVPAALALVAPGGEIWMLDSANFNIGTVSLTKSVTIMAVPGQVGSIVAVAGLPAIDISTSVTVSLRNVSITSNANSPGGHGIVISNGVLNIEDSVIAGLPGAGILATGVSTAVNIRGTVFRNLTGGFAISATSGPTVLISTSQFLNTVGIYSSSPAASSSTLVVLSDSQILGGGGEGLYASSTGSGAIARAACQRSTISGTAYALDSEGIGALVSAYGCSVTGNFHGIYQTASGVVRSLGNNSIIDNYGSEVGSLTTTTTR